MTIILFLFAVAFGYYKLYWISLILLCVVVFRAFTADYAASRGWRR